MSLSKAKDLVYLLLGGSRGWPLSPPSKKRDKWKVGSVICYLLGCLESWLEVGRWQWKTYLHYIMAALFDFLNNSPGNVVFFHTKCVSKVGRGRSPRRRVRDDDFMLGSCSDYPRIVFILAEAIQGFSADILNSEFRGRRSIW